MREASNPIRSASVLLAGGAMLILNSSYLAADGRPTLFYFGNVLFHLVLGIVLLLPFLRWWWQRRQTVVVAVGGGLLLMSAMAGMLLMVVGNLSPMRPLLWAHIGAAVLGLLVLAGSLPRHRMPAVLGLLALLALPLGVERYRQSHPDLRDTIGNPPAPASMEEEAMGGAEGPFFPSSVSTRHGGLVPRDLHLDPESCGGGGCHPDVVEQWRSSAHHFSSFNNQWYRKSIEHLQEVTGSTVSSKWCGGCHDPALLQTGMMDQPIAEVLETPEAQAGLTCTACHLISSVGSTMGQGDYEITVPPLHELASSRQPLFRWIHDFLVKIDPEPHRRTFLRPFYRGPSSPEYCSACHKVHLDKPVNNYRWIRGFNSYDNWQASGVSGYGARSFYYPSESQTCIDCHMPRVPSGDAGTKEGMIRSHRFAAANTALAVANGDDAQLRAVTGFLKANQVSVDIFALTHLEEDSGSGAGLALEGPALSTTFAVGEEQGMAVGMGTGSQEPLAPVMAPMDRLPARVWGGETVRVDVVVRTRGVGHFFPGGTVDAFDVWLELKALDDNGRVIFWSGAADQDSPVDPTAHFYRSLMIDAHGNAIDKRNAAQSRAVVYVRLIPPGAADTARFRLAIPEDAAGEIRLEARLNYRKFAWHLTQWSYAGIPDPKQDDLAFSHDFDDRIFVYTGDVSQVSGALQEIPTLPIVVLAEDSAVLQVVGADDEVGEGVAQEMWGDRERWNDYGIGLLLQGDLRAARHAFEQVARLEPDYVDGWVNLGRVALAEGDLDGAAESLEKALELEPELARAHFFAALRDKELGEYEKALEHLDLVLDQYPRDRVVRNQRARVFFLSREYHKAVAEGMETLTIDPEDLMAHYTLMLAYRGAGDLESSRRHQTLYERFKADEASQILTGDYLKDHPYDNNERQAIHEHGDGVRAPGSQG